MQEKIKIISKSALQTQKIAKTIAEFLFNQSFIKKALIIGLKGELGGGKTTFIQGFAKELCIKEKILSPTFVIMKNFKIPTKGRFKKLYHFDVYRIGHDSEMNVLGFKDILSDSNNIVLIEWIDLIQNIIPKDSILFSFKFIDENTREILIEAPKDILNQLKVLKLDSYAGK